MLSVQRLTQGLWCKLPAALRPPRPPRPPAPASRSPEPKGGAPRDRSLYPERGEERALRSRCAADRDTQDPERAEPGTPGTLSAPIRGASPNWENPRPGAPRRRSSQTQKNLDRSKPGRGASQTQDTSRGRGTGAASTPLAAEFCQTLCLRVPFLFQPFLFNNTCGSSLLLSRWEKGSRYCFSPASVVRTLWRKPPLQPRDPF
ncbi:unnamed protein product [Rangifer tarandus platyrhynchus]|uniref:Uncharacterized protein n=1 Tax=Rangifer tarandus platyrhynchus TaxID=3082113 RepID=A0AC59ZT56_RANTA